MHPRGGRVRASAASSRGASAGARSWARSVRLVSQSVRWWCVAVVPVWFLCLPCLQSLLSRLDCCPVLHLAAVPFSCVPLSPLCGPIEAMSAATHSKVQDEAAAAAASNPGAVRKRIRPEPDRADDSSDEQKQGAAHVSPVARLYRDAVESVFGFLALAGLSRVLAVSREWSAAVRSMLSIGASYEGATPPFEIAASSLASHVSDWTGDGSPLLPSNLFILSRPPFALRSLSCTVKLTTRHLYFGASLKSLALYLSGNAERVSAVNSVIVTISRLHVLEELDLVLPSYFPEVSFAPLAGAPQLGVFRCSTRDGEEPSHRQLDQLRMLSHLRTVGADLSSAGAVIYMLRAPHALQWQEIHMVRDIDDDVAAALSTLPTLTELDTVSCRNVSFLPALTRLRVLDLHMNSAARLAADIAVALSRCSQLTKLSLTAKDVTSQHLSQVLLHLPALRELALKHCSALDSLSFLSECTGLSQTLLSLWLHACDSPNLHSTQLTHVLSLKCLTELGIDASFVEPLDEFAQHLFTPPSAALPSLVDFQYY